MKFYPPACRELAYLNKGITLTITDEREKDDNRKLQFQTFFFQKGLLDFIDYLDANREKLMPGTHFHRRREEQYADRNCNAIQYFLHGKHPFLREQYQYT